MLFQARNCAGPTQNPEGPLNIASFKTAIVVGQLYYSQQLNLIRYKVLPTVSAVLLMLHLTLCVKRVL